MGLHVEVGASCISIHFDWTRNRKSLGVHFKWINFKKTSYALLMISLSLSSRCSFETIVYLANLMLGSRQMPVADPMTAASHVTSQMGLICSACPVSFLRHTLKRPKMTRDRPGCMTPPPVVCARKKGVKEGARWVTEAVTLWRHRGVGVGPASPAVSWRLPLWSDTLTLCQIERLACWHGLVTRALSPARSTANAVN